MSDLQERFKNPLYTEYVKEEIKALAKNWIMPARVSGYICPCCSSGDGPHGTGIMESKSHPNFFRCFSSRTGTCWDGWQDVIGIVRHMEKCSFYEAIEIAASKVGYEFPNPELFKDPDHLPAHSVVLSTNQSRSAASKKPDAIKLNALVQADIEKYHQTLEETDYFLKRGLSLETVKRFNCGYSAKWENPLVINIDPKKEYLRMIDILKKEGYGKDWETITKKSANPRLYMQKFHHGYLLNHNIHLWKPQPSRRFIIPTSEYTYLARAIDEPSTDWEKKYKKLQVGIPQPIGFNWGILKKNQKSPVFLVEGEIDAMSVEEVGYPAIALSGADSKLSILCQFIKDNNIKTNFPLVLAFDEDRTGRSTTVRAIHDLSAVGINSIGESIVLPGTKDPNESLCTNRDAFKKLVKSAAKKSYELQEKFEEGRRARSQYV